MKKIILFVCLFAFGCNNVTEPEDVEILSPCNPGEHPCETEIHGYAHLDKDAVYDGFKVENSGLYVVSKNGNVIRVLDGSMVSGNHAENKAVARAQRWHQCTVKSCLPDGLFNWENCLNP